MLREFCHRSKNLYNHGNFLIRQTFIEDGKWLRYGEVDRLLKADKDYPDYREMPTAQTAQQTLRLLDKNWTSFFAAIKDWKAHPEKYKPKDGYFPLVLTNQNCKLKDGVIRFPRTFQGFTVKAIFASQPEAVFKQARIIPHGGEIDLALVYELPKVEEKADNGKYAAIDIGVDNLAALAWNTGERPVLLKGTPLKSVNQYYNKQMAKRRSICELMNGRHSSKRIARLTAKRNRKVEDYLHKASRKVIDLCAEQDVSVLVVGKNKGWKQKANLGRKVNQNFVQLPFARFIQMLQYKAEAIGMKVVLTEESYTSGTSFLDGEAPAKDRYDKSRRVHRGLFQANDGRKINADINGAYQIMRKVFPNVNADGIEGVALRPTVVALSMSTCCSSGCA
ncbi:transposase, IS605 OrfB family [Mitsuokella multacida DSM 20544]|uniref:Transposase, IS605 OrfB family n=2 Tax=Mitsuokella multacida TaxID=52226 RepID=C9KLV6_9FIRM|nr:transposase, IS605 OrfB family [Mitsuokella multacida DSM 20544]